MKRLIILIVGLFWGGLLWGLTSVLFMSYAQGGQVTPPQKTVQGEVAADSDKYVIGPEDVLYIHVWKEEALTRQVPVRMDGKISLPLVDDVQAAGLTPLQLKETITRKFKQYISNPVVSVVVTEVNSFKIYVSGQVKNAGVHRLRGETTILQLIPLVGGFTDGADQKKITVIRKEGGKINDSSSITRRSSAGRISGRIWSEVRRYRLRAPGETRTGDPRKDAPGRCESRQ